jgi:hypothetical protein
MSAGHKHTAGLSQAPNPIHAGPISKNDTVRCFSKCHGCPLLQNESRQEQRYISLQYKADITIGIWRDKV